MVADALSRHTLIGRETIEGDNDEWLDNIALYAQILRVPPEIVDYDYLSNIPLKYSLKELPSYQFAATICSHNLPRLGTQRDIQISENSKGPTS